MLKRFLSKTQATEVFLTYVNTNEEKITCAVWLPPKIYQKMSFTGLSLISSWIKTVGVERILKVIKTSSIISKYHPKLDCFYLVALGTAPEDQGRGLGSDVIQPVIDTCDVKKIPIFLETSNEKNLSFYEKHGFKIQHEIVDPEKLPTTWTMLRKPRLVY